MALTPFTIDTLILIAFFLLNIIVGFQYRGKRQSFKEYAIGDKKFSTATLTATIVATWMSGSLLFLDLEKTYSSGLYFIIAVIVGRVIGLLLTGRVIGPRMGKFLNDISVPESLGKLYGKTVQVIAGIGTVLSSTGYIAMQLQIIARILAILFHYEGPEVVAVATIIITLYSLSGGVKAVTLTDVLQFFTFGTLLPILALAIWNNIHDHTQITHMFQTNPLCSFKRVVKWSPECRRMVILMCYLMTPGLPPQLFQRMVMARDTAQVKRSIGYATIIDLAINLCVMWIAIMILAEQPGLEPNKVMQYIVNTHTYPGLKGLLGIGVIALAMSTADSVLNSSAVIIANDILPPLGLQKESSLNTARWSTLVLGTLGLCMALSAQDLLQILLGAANFYAPIVAVPMLLAVFGFQTSRKVVLMAMGAGAVTVTAFLITSQSVNSFFPGMLANLVTMLGAHYLLKEEGGWQPLAPDDPLVLERVARKQAWQWRLQTIRQFKLYPYLEQNLPSQESLYFCFGFYTLVATYVALYMRVSNGPTTYHTMCSGIYHTVFPVTTAWMTFPLWPVRIKKNPLMAILWPLSIGGTLFFAGTLLNAMSHFHHTQGMVMRSHLLMAVLLLHWPLALFLALTGTCAALVFFTNYTGHALPMSSVGLLQLLYLIFLFASLLIALKGKQAYRGLATSHAQLKAENNFTSQMWLTTLRCWARLHHDATRYSSQALRRTRQLEAQLHPYRHRPTKAQLLTDNAALHQYTYQLDITNKHLTQILQQTQQPLTLLVEHKVLKTLWQDALQTLCQYKRSTKVITQNRTACQILGADPQKIQRLLSNGLAYTESYRKHDKHPLLLGLEDTQLVYPIISLPGYLKYVKAIRITLTTSSVLPKLKRWYVGSVDHVELRCPKDITALSIAYNQQIVAAHYGYAEMTTTYTEDVRLVYVIPWDVRTIRPPIMDQWHGTTTGANLETLAHPSEEDFVQTVHAQTSIDTMLLQEAIQLIKQYHGRNKYDTGELCYLRAMAVARIVLDYTDDVDTLLAALLHNIIDETHCSLHQITLQFNPGVQRIVEGVACVDSRLQSAKKLQLSHDEKIRKLLMCSDDRIAYVRLADRLHHMRTIARHPALAKQKQIAEETLRFFVPLAEKMALTKPAEELRKHCFSVLQNRQEQ